MAKAYEPKQIKNIADLDKVSIDLELKEVEYTTKDEQGNDKHFTVMETEIEGESYRVPTVVLKQLKAQLEANEDLKFFKVNKSGEGLKTQYTVIPLNE